MVPAPPDHLQAIVECEQDIQYVDCGRGFDWRPRLDGLKLVLDDGAKAVWIASPNYPTGTSCELEPLERMVDDYPGVQLLVDQRWGAEALEPPRENGRGTLFLRRQSPFLDKSGFLLCGTSLEKSQWMNKAGLTWVNVTNGVEAQSAGTGLDILVDALDTTRYRVTRGSGNWLFVQAPGTDGAMLASELREQGYQVDYEAVHTWRNGVCVWGKTHEN